MPLLLPLTTNSFFLFLSLADFLLITVAGVTFWQARLKLQGPGHWLVGYGLLAGVFPLYFFSPQLPLFWGATFPNALELVATLEIVRGTKTFHQVQLKRWFLSGITVVGLLLDLQYSFITPNESYRIFFVDLTVALLMIPLVKALMSVRQPQERIPTRFSGLAYMILAFFLLLRGILTLVPFVSSSLKEQFSIVILLALVLAFLALAFSHLQMVHARLLNQLHFLNMELQRSQEEVLHTLLELVESRSHETAFHVTRVAEYARCLGLATGMSPQQAELLALAAPLHDIGKIAIPDVILNKTDLLTAEERRIIQSHTSIGNKILSTSQTPLLKLASSIAWEHHERWDGTGYPQKKVGTQISLGGRIVGLCDVFDALATTRPYKPAWPVDQVLEYIQTHSGTHFDPQLVKLFFANLEKINVISLKYQASPG